MFSRRLLYLGLDQNLICSSVICCICISAHRSSICVVLCSSFIKGEKKGFKHLRTETIIWHYLMCSKCFSAFFWLQQLIHYVSLWLRQKLSVWPKQPLFLWLFLPVSEVILHRKRPAVSVWPTAVGRVAQIDLLSSCFCWTEVSSCCYLSAAEALWDREAVMCEAKLLFWCKITWLSHRE